MTGRRIANRLCRRLVRHAGAWLAAGLVLAAGAARPQSAEGLAFRITGPLGRPGTVTGGVPPRAVLQEAVTRLNAARPDMLVAVAAGETYEITLRFKAGRQADAIERTLRSALSTAGGDAGVSLSRVDADRLPVSLVLSGSFSPDQVAGYAIADVRPRLLRIAGAEEVTVCSSAHAGLRIKPDADIWRRLTGGADLHAALHPVIDAFNARTAGGKVSTDGDTYTIEAPQGRWIESLAELPVALPDGRSIPLQAFVTLSWQPLDTPEFCVYQGTPVVIVQLRMRKDTDPAAMLARLREAVAAISAGAPAGMTVTVYSDNAPQAR